MPTPAAQLDSWSTQIEPGWSVIPSCSAPNPGTVAAVVDEPSDEAGGAAGAARTWTSDPEVDESPDAAAVSCAPGIPERAMIPKSAATPVRTRARVQRPPGVAGCSGRDARVRPLGSLIGSLGRAGGALP